MRMYIPLSLDDSKAVDGKGNLLSVDGKNWFTAAESAISGNLNIRVNVAPNSNDTEATPVGYNIYRDGVKVNSTPVAGQSFDDVLSNAGTYSYQVTSVYADGGESSLAARLLLRLMPSRTRRLLIIWMPL